MNKAILCIGVLFLLTSSVFAQDRVTIDNLEAVLTDLRAKTQSLTEDNNALTSKNKMLRNRIENFEDDLNDLQLERATLNDAALRLKGAPNEEARQTQSWEQEILDLERKKAALKRERASLEESVNTKLITESSDQGSNTRLIQEITGIKNKIGQLQTRNGRSFDDQKAALSREIQASQGRQNKLKAQLNSANALLRQPGARVAALKEEQRRLDENLRQVKEELAAITQGNETLRQAAGILGGEKTSRVAGLTQEVNSLRARVRELEDFIRDSRDLKKQAASKFNRSRLETISRLLKNENRLLSAKRDLLSGRPVSGENQSGAAETPIPAFNEKLEQLKDNYTQLTAKIQEHQKREAVLAAKLKNLQHEKEQYQKQLRTTRGGKTQSLAQRKNETASAIKESITNQNKFKKAWAELEVSGNALEKTVKDLKDKQFLLTRHLQEISQAAPEPAPEPAVPAAQIPAPPRASDLTEELETLRSQASELEDLLTLVKKQYNENDTAVREFHNEKQKLGEYLAFLKEENQKLRDEWLEWSNKEGY